MHLNIKNKENEHKQVEIWVWGTKGVCQNLVEPKGHSAAPIGASAEPMGSAKSVLGSAGFWQKPQLFCLIDFNQFQAKNKSKGASMKLRGYPWRVPPLLKVLVDKKTREMAGIRAGLQELPSIQSFFNFSVILESFRWNSLSKIPPFSGIRMAYL